MAETTPRLALPYLLPNQAQKHVTVNDALSRLDALVQLAPRSRSLAAPPDTPAEGDTYLLPDGASGAWTGHDGALAAWIDGVWTILAPAPGWRAWIVDEAVDLVFGADGWGPVPVTLPDGGLVRRGAVGIGTDADLYNRLAVKAPGSLFTHSDEGGDHRLVLNRRETGATGTLLFQTGFSGRAELGLAGDDRFRLKVSANGADWVTALEVDPATGTAHLPGLDPGGGLTPDPDGLLGLESGLRLAGVPGAGRAGLILTDPDSATLALGGRRAAGLTRLLLGVDALGATPGLIQMEMSADRFMVMTSPIEAPTRSAPARGPSRQVPVSQTLLEIDADTIEAHVPLTLPTLERHRLVSLKPVPGTLACLDTPDGLRLFLWTGQWRRVALLDD